ncbi:multi-sensor hybrid histidine kinase [Caballeronia concitans]|uniref:Virulence sensor protein BvgS n=2 Tax=Caballeronia concitans TaxID=1777133 RepID=A0A658QU40_9BURK|nr:GAF sensor hybrid histidine kinase [Burkholderia sp. MR1]SAL21398.1 multi-sensor hybrid histidine kinase [Caballeronia concitans]
MDAVVTGKDALNESELRLLIGAVAAVRRGEPIGELPSEWDGMKGRLVAELAALSDQCERQSRSHEEIGVAYGEHPGSGKRLSEAGLSGFWLRQVRESNGLLEAIDHAHDRNRAVHTALTAVLKGQGACLPSDWTGLAGKIADAFNAVVDQNLRMSDELARLSQAVGKEGRINERAAIPDARGFWRSSMDSVNSLIADLVHPTSEVARVIGAVAQGDLSKSMALEADGRALQGEFLRTAKIINRMVEQLGTFSAEVTRVAREVGTEGKLGGQADVQGVAGTWKDLTDSVNFMAGNLTSQVRNIAEVTKAVAAGDLSKKITVDVKGEILELKNTINTMVDQLRSFAAEVTRVAREVGTEGKLGGQAEVKGVAGTWKDLTDNVNFMAGNLTSQVRNIAEVTTAVAAGDLSKKITVDVKGEILELKNTINTMVDQLRSFASEVTRVAREVGTEGKLGGQADVKGVAGTWKDLTDSVNSMGSNLTAQVRNIADVTTAVAAGDLSKKITVDVKGEILELKNTINTMVDQLSSFASEVTRVAREVGTEGKLGGQADVQGVAGTWKDLTDSVNSMGSNLTAQVRNIADVTTAVAAGDLSKKITVDVKGEILELKNTINTMVDQLRSFASEVTRVAREVGTEGKLGGQADVQGVAGTWKDLTDSVNSMGSNLTAQVRNIAEVTTAVAAGDLSKKITVDVKGEILELKNTINTMVDQLRSFASEVTRVAREVGTEGKLGGQADVQGVAGTWKDLTDNVNFMAGNLTSQVRNIADVTKAVAAGDLSKKITVDVKGEILELKNTINTMVDQLSSFASEVTRVAREVGTLGKLGGQADVQGVAGTWKDLTDSVNFMAGNLTSQVRNIADVTKAVAAGDLSKKITVDVKGEILELKNTINTMVDQLRSFASEVTRVAREVGTEGKLGGQADVQGVAGTWKDLTDNVNFMAGNLTSQVRGIARVVTAVANGDLARKLTVEAKGEIAALADTINSMTDTLATFADQVTTVAREVGVEGKLGGQAKVPGAAGTWKGLTENVNQLAANLTTQVRAIAEVATAVTQGDLTRSITVEALGEVAALKDTINEMIRNLKDTTALNTEQDWLKTNLAKFSRMLQGQKDLVAVGHLILSELAPVVGVQQAEFFVLDASPQGTSLKLVGSYASDGYRSHGKRVALGEGLVGQCAVEKRKILLAPSSSSDYRIVSGLLTVLPQNVLVLPVVFEGHVKGVIELASVERFNPTHQAFLDQLTESIGIVINTIEANMRTEDLLKQSQSLAHELQSRQEELQQTNQELQEKARLLAHQNQEVERKSSEVEQARQALEDKAKQLALTSKYKSEFLANMSHELRTPLNSLLILSDQLCKNPEGNLSPRQVEFAKTIHSSGNDLLMLINDILDLAKIESGTVVVDLAEHRLADLTLYVERTFRHVAEARNVDFFIQLGADVPSSIVTDLKRLQQILKNLLSNAFKFTHRGHVTLTIDEAFAGWGDDSETLGHGGPVLAFSVQDTGIGISPDKQQIVFEAFQQADGSTSRKYGGTGLGLAISRELSKLLGGEIRLTSTPNKGSTFTLYLPSKNDNARSGRRSLPFFDGASSAAANGAARVTEAQELSRARSYRRDEVTDATLVAPFPDDRDHIVQGDRVVLIVENDAAFARVVADAAREGGMKAVVTAFGADALTLAARYKPDFMTLDVFLADMEGWRILSRLKQDMATRHIPVCVVSSDEFRERALRSGAFAFIPKPIESKETLDLALSALAQYVGPRQRTVLATLPEGAERDLLVHGLDGSQAAFTIADSRETLLRHLSSSCFDVLVLADGTVAVEPEDIEQALSGSRVLAPLPVILRADDITENPRWQQQCETFVAHPAASPEMLFDLCIAALHVDANALPPEANAVLSALRIPQGKLHGKKALIVDDDMRNIFALATVMEDLGMRHSWADNGRDAVNQVEADPEIDIVLMDVMMPEMDGLTTIREIRKRPVGRALPIIAVTAKAMKGDREKCIEAGAWDYLSKPVNLDDLLAVLHAWLHR